MVPTVERGLWEVDFCSIEIAGESPSIWSTSGFSINGQRRYVESLSAYARQFLSLMEKPDVDHIEGLSPAISIEQKSTSSILSIHLSRLEHGLPGLFEGQTAVRNG